MSKVETAAQRYLRLKESRLVDFTSPSGMVWRLRRPNLQMFVTNGVLPLNLASKIARGDGKTSTFETLSDDEQAKLIAFANQVIGYCAVDPKIVEVAENDDEIGFKDVELDDYEALVKWALPGGGESENLEAFRGERQDVSEIRPDVP